MPTYREPEDGGVEMAHRYRLYPDDAGERALERHCADARFVWNLALEQFGMWRPGRQSVSSAERFRQLAEARRTFPWLGQGSSSVQQQALRDFDQALRNWRAGTHRRPRWRRHGRDEGFCVRDVTAVKLNGRWAAITVPKCGRVRFRLSRPLPAEYGMARITCDPAGRWHVSYGAPQPVVERVSTGRSVGVDRGVVNTAAFSEAVEGSHFAHIPGLSAGQAERRRRLARRWSRQIRGSNGREKTRRALAKLAALEADRAKDWIEKITTHLVAEFDVVVLEALHVKQMMRSATGTVDEPGRNVAAKRGLNREIARSRWGLFARRLSDKAATCGVDVVFVDAAYTSQTCACGHVASGNRKSQAVFECEVCGYRQHADVQAARTIRERGIGQKLAPAPGHGVAAGGDLQPQGGSGNPELQSEPPATEVA